MTATLKAGSVPTLNMEFQSIEEAGAFYRAYGRSRGFLTRKRSSYATRVIFVCCCEGLHKKCVDASDDDGEKKKSRTPTMRTGCYGSYSFEYKM